ncbi:MAG: hypothetical protein HN472_16115 [Nitrospina sp.]|jgi:hypothetical protein|nr:hypothetical protein [Nitrospina sp.]
MKEFYIFVNGTWSFDYQIEANTKEEAICQAMKDMDQEARCIELYHVDQYVEEDTGSGVSGPGIGDMKISDEFFPKIWDAKLEEDGDNRPKSSSSNT